MPPKKKTTPKKPVVTDKQLSDAVAAFHTIKNAKAEIETALADAQDDLIDALNGAGLKTIDVELEDDVITVTLVEPESVVIDWEGLRDDLGEDVFNKHATVVVRVESEDALETAVNNGDVAMSDVEANSTIRAKKPFIKRTIKKAEQQGGKNNLVKTLKAAAKEPKKPQGGRGARAKAHSTAASRRKK